MRIPFKTVLAAMALAASAAVSAHAAESFLQAHAPVFSSGGEFPGAKGGAEVVDDELRLHYDFNGGGRYVSARFALTERPKAKTVSFEANMPDSTEVTVRVVDATGQTFQRRFIGSTDGEWMPFSLAVDGIGAHWGGAGDGKLHLPLTGLAFLAENTINSSGVLRVRNISFSEQALTSQKAPGLPFDEAAAEASRLRDEIACALPNLERRGLGAKTRSSLAVMDYFQSWIQEDVARGFTNRAEREMRELVSVGCDAKSRIQAIAEGKVRDFPVPHFVTGPTEMSHAQIVGTREWPDGRRERGNVMLTGFGHLGRVQREQGKLPPIGNNIIQMEIGPKSVLKDEHVVDTNGLAAFFRAAELGARENVQVCLLLSPHYFPQWALKKWPHLSGCAGGFFKYCVHDENAQSVIEKYLRTVIPLVRGNPALHSVCLSNEPAQGRFGPECALRKKWPIWLERRYGTVAAMNAKWGTSYASFADVPMPKDFKNNPATPAMLEFVRFNRRAFAAFHRRMAKVIHELAPELPVHAKIMIDAGFEKSATAYSVDPAAFALLGTYNGNDAHVAYRGDRTLGDNMRGWVHDWWAMEAGYDYQRSAADKPVFNTENHIIDDREKRFVPGRHVYAALWQNAVHGQSATALWAWERVFDNGRSDFNGLILERPVCLAAWAHAALDLSRLADALAPIQNQEPTILLHHSLSSDVLGKPSVFLSCYRAASFLGQPLGVATEDMLAEFARTGIRKRPLASARVVLLPSVTHMPDSARDGLKKLEAQGVKVIACRGKPKFDDCCRPRNADDFSFLDAPTEKGLSLLFAERAAGWSLPDFPRVRSVDSEKGVYGVESHGYRTNGVSRVTFINHLAKPVRVRLEKPGHDLLSGTDVPKIFDLPSGVPMFISYPSGHELNDSERKQWNR